MTQRELVDKLLAAYKRRLAELETMPREKLLGVCAMHLAFDELVVDGSFEKLDKEPA